MSNPSPLSRRLMVLFILMLVPVASGAQPYLPHFHPQGRGPTYTDAANGTTTAVPSLEAFRLDGQTIIMDGRLDDQAWHLAQAGWGLRQADPERGAQPSVPSIFKVAYDDDNIYFAMACYEADMANLASYLGRRDEIEASDLVSIYIDPYHDHTTGYNFRVNAAGVMQDDYIFDNGDRDRDWDAVWQAEVTRDDHGWYVEIRVPFAAIRFQPADDMTWGLQAYRWLHGRGEDTGWVMWDRNSSGFVSRWGTLTGLRGVSNPRQLEVLPYVVTKHTDPAVEGDADQWQNHQNLGADLKYGVTSNLTLNVTFQPDFGQVEADPATLNLSPFETFFSEKRPFFIEGARYFQHPDFNLFYSRRIGTGHPDARIRGAAKLTGKIAGSYSIAGLLAATDIGQDGRAHNPFVGGTQKAVYGLLRLGKEFAQGNHRVNLMGTAVERDKSSFADASRRRQRDGYTGGLDFETNFRDRDYRVSGSMVGTVVDPFASEFDPTLSEETRYGTGGRLRFAKRGGRWRGSLAGRWESDKLDPNDMGFLSAPDEKIVSADASYHYTSDGDGGFFDRAEFEAEVYRGWLYAGNAGHDINDGAEVWRYSRSHHQFTGINFNTWTRLKNFHEGWIFVGHNFDGSEKYTTRTYEGKRGPLITQPGWTNIAAGGTTDWRQPLSVHAEIHTDFGSNLQGLAGELSLRWNQNEHFHHELGFSLRRNRLQAQWVGNFANSGARAGVAGIGGVDYVFGELDQMIWDLTLRTNLLFDRNHSLQLYLQPFLTRGVYTNAKYLATADSYDVRSYPNYAVSDHDFNFGAVNLNLVYRWEYQPGSTLFLVWTHSKLRDQTRQGADDPDRWQNDFDAGFPFGVEPGNTLLAKFTYWFSI